MMYSLLIKLGMVLIWKGTVQYIDTTALPEIIYYYKVMAGAGQGYSPFSNTVAGER